MTDNFYITGGTLPPDTDSYVCRRADTELLTGLRNGEFCYVLNTRQMGKSSLMARSAARLREEGHTVAILDLTAIGQNLSIEQWYAGLLGSMTLQLDGEDALFEYWSAHRELGPMQRFLETIRGALLSPAPATKGNLDDYPGIDHGQLPPEPGLVIFVDEIDVVRSLPFSADEFFAGIRECYNRRSSDPKFKRLTFCLLGVATPSDLIRDTRISPFNIGRRIELRDFTPEEAEPLAAGLNHPNALKLLRRIMYWTNGHPYLTQLLCKAVAEIVGGTGRPEGARAVLTPNIEHLTPNFLVDGLVDRLFLSHSAQETDDNLNFVRSRILRSEADTTTLLDMYLRVRTGKRVRNDETNPLCAVLGLSGITAAENGLLRTRNRVYERVFDRKWVMEHLPNAEVIRQSRAFRLGVFRTAGLASVIISIISGLAVNSYFLARKARASAARSSIAETNAKNLAAIAERRVYAANMVQLQKAFDDHDLSRARSLLDQTAAFPNRGFEWNYWNRILHNELLSIPAKGPLSLLAWSRDGRWIATQPQSSLTTPHLELWDSATGIHLRTLPGRAARLRGVMSPVSSNLVALVDAKQGEAGRVSLCDPVTGDVHGTLPESAIEATLLADGRTVLTVERMTAKPAHIDYCLKAWNAISRQLIYTVPVSGTPSFGSETDNGTVQSTVDGRILCSGGSSIAASPLTILDAATGSSLWTPQGAYMHQALSAHGRYLATSDTEGYGSLVRMWDLLAHHEMKLPAEARSFPACNLIFSPDERRLLFTGGLLSGPGEVWMCDVATGRIVRRFSGHRSPVYYASFSADASYLLTMSTDHTARQWDVRTGHETGIYPVNYIHASISPDSTRFLSADLNSVQIYSSRPGQTIEYRKYPRHDGFSFTPDGRTLMFEGDGSLSDPDTPIVYGAHDIITDGETSVDTDRITYYSYPQISSTAWGNHIAYSAEHPVNRVAAELHDRLTGRRLAILRASHVIKLLALATDDSLATVSLIDGAKVWRRDGSIYREIFRLPVDAARVVFFSFLHNGRILICGTDDRRAVAWDTQTQRSLYSFPIGILYGWPQIAEAPDGSVFTALDHNQWDSTNLAVYDCVTGARTIERDNATLFYSYNAISPDSRKIVWGDFQQLAHVINISTNRELPALNVDGYLLYASWSADSSRLLTSSITGACKLWDGVTGAELMTLHLPGAGQVFKIGFSPDGNTIAAWNQTPGNGNTTYIWDAVWPRKRVGHR